MNKSELIEAVAERAELSKAAVNKAIDAMTEVITSVISAGNPVALIGFGTFKSVKRAARTGKNPKTGAALKIAAKSVPKFSAGAGLKAAVAGKKPVAKKAAAKKPAAKKPAAKKPAAKPAAKKAAAKKK
ncbi:MAG: HU family DNA-binding protein [Sulfuritalea sp.]|nr:HU family DNA-binding protein [Sulfuritalea sp.]